MTRKLYKLNHPLYPHPELKAHYDRLKLKYTPRQGSYDDAYNNWYQRVRADHDLSGAPIREIYSEISQIIRIRSANKEYIKYSETLFGQDHEHLEVPFFHTYGEYDKPLFRTSYNYETKQTFVIPTGQIEHIYFIPFTKETIDELYTRGPEDNDIELLINVGSKQYGGRGFFKLDEFRDLAFEDLGKKGARGNDMYTQPVTPISFDQARQEFNALGITDTQEQKARYDEFIQFQKFKEEQRQKDKIFKKLEEESINNKGRKITVRGASNTSTEQ